MTDVILNCLLGVGENGYVFHRSIPMEIVTVKFQNYQCLEYKFSGCTGFQTLQKIAPAVLV